MTGARFGKLPPLARAVVGVIRKGYSPAGAVRVLPDHWPDQRPVRTSYPPVVLPPDVAPDIFDWRFLAGLDVIVMHRRSLTERDRLRELLRCLLGADPRRVLVFDLERHRTHWVKSVLVGQEVRL